MKKKTHIAEKKKKTKYLKPQKNGTGYCPNCKIVIYPDELGCGCGAKWPN